MSNLLTPSRYRAFRECHALHGYLYEDGLRPIHEAEYFQVGTGFHEGCGAWWLHPEARLAAALAVVKDKLRDPYQQAAVEELLRGYDARWKADADRYLVLHIEQSTTVPLLNPETMAKSRTFLLAGKIDLIVRDRESGRVLLMEHKTTSEDIRQEADYWLKLAMDGQVSHYYLLAEGLGVQVQGCVYDVVSKPGKKPLKATPIESRKYTKAGALYANQREVDETPDEYRARVAEDIASYPELYYQRREVPRLESDLRDYLADAWSEAAAIRAGSRSRNPDACHRFGRCAFWDVCAYHVEPSQERFRRLANVHPELSGEVGEEERKESA